MGSRSSNMCCLSEIKADHIPGPLWNVAIRMNCVGNSPELLALKPMESHLELSQVILVLQDGGGPGPCNYSPGLDWFLLQAYL